MHTKKNHRNIKERDKADKRDPPLPPPTPGSTSTFNHEQVICDDYNTIACVFKEEEQFL